MRRSLLMAAAIALAAFFVHSFDDTNMPPRAGDLIGAVQAELTDGSAFRLAQPPQEPVVITFWASWCVPCRHEVPVLNELHARGHRILGIAVDALPLATVKQQAADLGIRYPVGLGADGLAERLGVRAVPTTFVVGRDGRVALAHAGGISRDELGRAIATAQAR